VGDTIEYNADAYKVQDGATAEDLVSKMPGIEVTDEGVKAQGETVEKLLVDGKSFFENDVKQGLKSLPAEVVDRVKVFDKKSDQAEFTGFDDGQTVKAMDLKTKSYRRNGVFGKVYGSLGNNFDFDNPYWNFGTNLNIFNGNRRFSILAMSNNVNQQDFTFDDLISSGGMRGMGGRFGNRVGMQAGVSRANAISINYNDSYLDDKLTIQGNYSFNNTRTVSENESLSDNFGDSARHIARNSSLSNSNSLSHNTNHRLDMHINYRPSDRDEFIFRPSLSLQKSDSRSYSDSRTWRTSLDSVLMQSDLWQLDQTNMYDYNRRHSMSDNTGWNLNGMLTWRHKFNKTGRTLSSMVNASVSGTDSESNSIRLGSPKSVRAGEHFQNNNSTQNNWSLQGNMQYTEALGETSQLSARYNVNYSEREKDTKVGYDTTYMQTYGENIPYDFDTYLTEVNVYDGQNTSKYISKELRHGGELAYRMRTESFNVMAGINLEASHVEGEQDNYAWSDPNRQNPSYNTTKNYFSVLPNLRLEWRPWEGGSINVDYRARTSNPSIDNLQETVNTSNVSRYTTGNKDLDQTTSHNIGVRLIHSNMETATNLMIFANYSFEDGHIGNEEFVNRTDSFLLPLTELSSVKNMSAKQQEQYSNLSLSPNASFSRPINMGGSRSAHANVSYGFPFDLLLSNVNVSLGGSYSDSEIRRTYFNSYNASTGWEYSEISAKQRSYSVTPRIGITSNISQDLDFRINYSMSYNRTNNVLNTANNTETLNQNANAKLTWTFWKGFTTEQEISYNYNGGASMPKVVDEWIWNMSIGRKFLKNNAGELKLQVYDLLQSRTGYSQNISATSFSQSYSNYMPRYFMLTFSYKIANYKSSSEIKERQRGGFGGGFGGPGPRF